MPPPKVAAKLPVKLLPATVAEPALAMPPPSSPARLSVKVVPLTPAVAPVPMSSPPPILVAELTARVLLIRLIVLPLKTAMPAPTAAELPVKLLAFTLTEPAGPLIRPPPTEPAELLTNVLPLTLAVPTLAGLRRSRGGVAGEGAADHRRRRRRWRGRRPELAELPVKVLSLTVTVPDWLTMPPPPSLAELPVKVLPLTVAVPPRVVEPPPLVAELPVKVLSLTVTVPPLSLTSPPPTRGGVAGEGAAGDRRGTARRVVDSAAAGARSCR